jgi:hypothetical protein
MAGWLVKTIAGAAITAVVGFFVTQHLQSQYRQNRGGSRMETDRRVSEPRRLDQGDRGRRGDRP